MKNLSCKVAVVSMLLAGLTSGCAGAPSKEVREPTDAASGTQPAENEGEGTEGSRIMPQEGKEPGKEGEMCGGMMGMDCEAGLFCLYEESAHCGAADQTGSCALVPEVCTMDFKPVCGCDDKTYPNACGAHAKGVSVASQGECGKE